MTAASLPYAFLSYSRRDQAFAAHLARDLRAHGIHLWFDQLDIAPGDDWDEAIQRALHAAGAVLFVVSADSVTSDHVLNELTVALDAGKWVIPITIAPVPVPLRIARMQRVDFTSNYEAAFRHLVAHMRGGGSRTRALEAIAAAPRPPERAPGHSLEPLQVSSPPRSRRSSWVLPALVGGIVAAGGSVALLILVGVLMSRGEPQPGAGGAAASRALNSSQQAVPDAALESIQGSWLGACRPAADGTAQQAALTLTRDTYTGEVSYFAEVACARPLYKVRLQYDIVNMATIRDGVFAADYRVRSIAVVPIEAAESLNSQGAFGRHDWSDGTASELGASAVTALFGVPLPVGTATYDLIAVVDATLREGRNPSGHVATTSAERPTELDDAVYFRQ